MPSISITLSNDNWRYVTEETKGKARKVSSIINRELDRARKRKGKMR